MTAGSQEGLVIPISAEVTAESVKKMADEIYDGVEKAGKPIQVTLVADKINVPDKVLREVSSRVSKELTEKARGIEDKDRKEALTKTADDLGEQGKRSSPVASALKSRAAQYAQNVMGENGAESQAKALKQAANVTKSGADMLINISKKSLDLVQQIFDRIKAASPLLQAVENLFNLAMTLFFMPLGNKLATVLIPAVMELVDDVVALWDEYGDGGLDEMFNAALERGVEIFASFFDKVVKAIGDSGNPLLQALKAIAELVSNLLTSGFIPAIINLAAWIVKHLPALFATIVALFTTTIGLLVTSILVQMTSITAGAGAAVGAAGLAVTLAAAAAAGVGTYAAGKSYGMATGGYVEPVPGGSVHLLAEAGEGEWVVPESKMAVLAERAGVTDTDIQALLDGSPLPSQATAFGSTAAGTGGTYISESSTGNTTTNLSRGPTYITYNIQGYTDAELIGKIKETTSDMVREAGYLGGI